MIGVFIRGFVFVSVKAKSNTLIGNDTPDPFGEELSFDDRYDFTY